MRVTVLRAGAHRRMRWKNGLGWTHEIAREPAEEREDFAWRVSVAEVEADCEFSEFVAVDRSILVLEGAGMELRVGGVAATVTAEGPALAFAGEGGGRCRLLAGPTRDFNVMTRRGVAAHALERVGLGLAGRAGLACARGTMLVYVAQGRAVAAGQELGAGDCVRIEAVPGDSLQVDGAAELVVVRVWAV